jgi:hypothetical protein
MANNTLQQVTPDGAPFPPGISGKITFSKLVRFSADVAAIIHCRRDIDGWMGPMQVALLRQPS